MHTKSKGSGTPAHVWLHRLVLLGLLASAVPAGGQTITNGLLTLSWSEQTGTLTSEANQVAVNELRFPWTVAKVAQIPVDDATFGSGEALRLTHEHGWTTTLALFPQSPFLHCSTQVNHVEGGEPLVLRNVAAATWKADLGVPRDEVRVLGTGGLTTVDDAKGSYAFSIVADPESRCGVVSAWLTHRQGVGVFFPEPTTHSAAADDQSVAVRGEMQFGRFQVDPGAQRETETLLIGLFDDCRLGIEAYADAVAANEAIQLLPKPNVYCTWYHAGASNAEKLAENTQFAAEYLKPFGLNVMQIDDLWQTPAPKGSGITREDIEKHGPYKSFVDAGDNYPAGMAAAATEIRGRGMTAGIWFMPFAGNHRNPYFDQAIFAKRADGTPFEDYVANWSGTCIDLTSPAGEAFVRQRVRRIHDWGYRYFKIDGAHTGIPTPNIYVNTSYRDDNFGEAVLHDPRMTHAQAYRKGLSVLREEAPDTFVLGCNVSQNMRSMGPAFGKLDAMRIGPDNGSAGRGDWRQVTLGAWHGTNLYFLNNRVWHNDPDPVYVRESNPLERARWMCTWMAIAGALHTSSEQYAELSQERLDLLRRCLPSHDLPARPVDYLETDRPRIWRVERGNRAVLGLFNWDEAEPTAVRYPLSRIGLADDQPYVGFDYWNDRFVLAVRDALDVSIPPASCVSLALRAAADHPQVVSTSRHITQGLIDLHDETWVGADRVLHGECDLVADDRYELRIVAPPDFDLSSVRGMIGDQECAPSHAPHDPPNTVRLSVTPNRTGRAVWRIQF